LQNYPNPFNSTTLISFDLFAASHVTLKIYDILGREVQTLVNGAADVGRHQVILDGSNLSTGVYFYLLHAGDFKETRKLVILN
jgi:hypothetical protein